MNTTGHLIVSWNLIYFSLLSKQEHTICEIILSLIDMNSDSWCFHKRISTIIFYLLYLLCFRTHLCCDSNQPSCCILKKVRHSAGVWRVLSPPPPPPSLFSLSLSLSPFTFQFSHWFSYCLSSSVWMVSCLKLLSYFLSLYVDPSLSPSKKKLVWHTVQLVNLFTVTRRPHASQKRPEAYILVQP